MTFCPGDRELVVLDHDGWVRRYGPDHRQVAATRLRLPEGERHVVDCAPDGTVAALDGTAPVQIDRSGRVIAARHDLSASDARFAPDGSVHVIAEDGLHAWRGDRVDALPAAPEPMYAALGEGAAYAESLYHDPPTAADGLWITRDGTRVRLEREALDMFQLSVAGDGGLAVADEMTAYAWEPSARGYGPRRLLVDDAGTQVWGVAASRRWFVVSDGEGLAIFARPGGKPHELAKPCGPDGYHAAFAIAHDDQRVAVACSTTGIRLYDLATRRALGPDEPSSSAVALAWSADGHALATSGLEGPIRVWRDGALVTTFARGSTGDDDPRLWWTAPGELEGTAGWRLAAWSAGDGKARELPELDATHAAYASGTLVAAYRDNLVLRVARGGTTTKLALPDARTSWVLGVAIDPAARRAIVLRDEHNDWPPRELVGVDLATGRATTLATEPVTAAAVDSDAAYAALGSGAIERFAGGAPTALARLPDVTALAVSPRLVAAGTADGSIVVWTKAGAPVATLPAAHTAPVRALAFSPDGTHLASAGTDATLIWTISG